MNYIYAAQRPWSLNAFLNRRRELPGDWSIVTDPSDLGSHVRFCDPELIFFPHWSNIVPSTIVEGFECVCFHMTDVPYGRGGSPLQNLITRGATSTVISALRMRAEVDAGPVYMKRPLGLEGSAEEIFVRAADVILDMITEIVRERPTPVPQVGDVEVFRRRTSSESAFPATGELGRIYDHIRMLDAPGYPKAFVESGDLGIEFSRAKILGDRIIASAEIRVSTSRDLT